MDGKRIAKELCVVASELIGKSIESSVKYDGFPKTFWVVTNITGGDDTLGDICFESDVKSLMLQSRGGLNFSDIYGMYTSERKAKSDANSLLKQKQAASGRTEMVCLECGHKFKKKIGPRTVEVKCPKCGGYDTDLR